jgi:hypothetical protein
LKIDETDFHIPTATTTTEQSFHSKPEKPVQTNGAAALGPQIHTISDETHYKIHALLTDHQKELENAMQQCEHQGEESRRPAPPI